MNRVRIEAECILKVKFLIMWLRYQSKTHLLTWIETVKAAQIGLIYGVFCIQLYLSSALRLDHVNIIELRLLEFLCLSTGKYGVNSMPEV